MRRIFALVLLAACTDPVVEMELVLPKNADNFATSCITAVEVHATGADIATDNGDYKYACMELSGGGMSYAAIRDEIQGKFELDIPDSGLSGIEVFGWSGPEACAPYPDGSTPDLLFLGRGDYIGQSKIDIPLVANLACADTPIKVRMYDMFALVKGATCDVAGTMNGTGGAGVGTMVPRMIGRGVDMYGFLEGAPSTGNTATFTGPMQTGGHACVAIDGGQDMVMGTTSCYNGGASVCAAAGEVEHPMIPFAIMYNGANYKDDLVAKFPGVVFGSVWNNATPRTTLAGAKVTIDPAHGTVIYVDPPDANGLMTARADQSATGPSGLFILYTDTVASVKVEGNGVTRSVLLASFSDRTAGAMIVMAP